MIKVDPAIDLEIDQYFAKKRAQLSPKITTYTEIEHHTGPSIVNKFILKGILHFTDENKSYEVLQEQFFYTGLENNGEFVSESDIDVYLDYNLKDEDWGNFLPLVDECYSVFWVFDLKYSSYDTSCGLEHDSEILTTSLYFSKIDGKHTEWLLSPDEYK